MAISGRPKGSANRRQTILRVSRTTPELGAKGRYRRNTMTQDAGEFIPGVSLHVLRKGLHRIRHHGPNA